MQKENTVRNLSISLLMLAATAVFSFVEGWFSFGDRLLLWQIPVLLCGLLAGAPAGAVVGLLTPFFSFAVTGTPAIFPDAIAMALECMLFGAAASPVFRSFARSLAGLYIGLCTAMVTGRLGYMAAMYIMIELQHTPFSVRSLLNSEFLRVWPGLLLQLLLIPAAVFGADALGLLDDE